MASGKRQLAGSKNAMSALSKSVLKFFCLFVSFVASKKPNARGLFSSHKEAQEDTKKYQDRAGVWVGQNGRSDAIASRLYIAALRFFKTPRCRAKIDHRTKNIMGRKTWGKKMAGIFLPSKVVASDTRYGLCRFP